MGNIVRSNFSTISRPVNSQERFSELEQNLLEFTFEKINPFDKNFEDVYFHISEFYQAMGYTHQDYNDIRKALKRVQKVQIKIQESNAIWVTYTSWLSSVTFDEEPGSIRIGINPEIKKHLVGLQKNFVQYDSEHVFKLNGSYSKQLYVLFKSQAMRKDFVLSMKVDEMRDILCVEDKYPRYADLKRRILMYVLDEINNKTDLEIEFKEVKFGGKVKTIHFFIDKRDVSEPKKTELNPVVQLLIKHYGFTTKTAKALVKDREIISIEQHMQEAEKYMRRQRELNKEYDQKKIVAKAIREKWGIKTEAENKLKKDRKQKELMEKPLTQEQLENIKAAEKDERLLDLIFNSDKPEIKKLFYYFLDYVREEGKTDEKKKEFLNNLQNHGHKNYCEQQPMIVIAHIKEFINSERGKKLRGQLIEQGILI